MPSRLMPVSEFLIILKPFAERLRKYYFVHCAINLFNESSSFEHKYWT